MLSIQKEKVLHFPTKHREKLVILRDRGMIGLARPLSLPSTCTCQGPFSSSNICHIIKHKPEGNVSKAAEGKANALPLLLPPVPLSCNVTDKLTLAICWGCITD